MVFAATALEKGSWGISAFVVETARLLLYKTAWLKKTGKPAQMEAAMAKLYLGEVFTESSMDAIRIHGGYGYSTEFAVERDLSDAIGGYSIRGHRIFSAISLRAIWDYRMLTC